MSNPVSYQSGGKSFVEEVVNGKIVLREVASVQQTNAVPASTLEAMLYPRVDARVHNLVDPVVSDLKKNLETCELHDAGTFEYEAEKWRWLGQSGLVGTRQYTYGGTKAYHRPFDISYNPMNFHTHADYLGLQGMAEIVLSMNGYYIRTRHNDYRDWQPHKTSSAYQAVERVQRPSVPPTVGGTVAQQRAGMQDLYVRAYRTLNGLAGDKLTETEKQYFRWDMAYAEVWWELLTDGVTNDPGNDTRHVNASNDVRQMLREAQYYNYGGHKNRFENTGYWVAGIKEVNVNGTPSYAVLKFRILTFPVATLRDYLPSQLFDNVQDYKALMRGGFNSFSDLYASSWGRFRVKENRDGPGLLDTLINKIPGLDNGPGNLTEIYDQYGVSETIYNMTNSAVNNAARYFRYSFIMSDASGRDMEKRGFNDPYLFVAMNTREQVKKYNINGRDYRFSYMVPLEMLLRHPLEVWNPYGIGEGNVTGLGTAVNPFSNNNEDGHWYRTPASFFDQRSESDAADTVKTGRFYRGADGQSYATEASGTYIFLPQITAEDGSALVPGNGIRTRWPIYPVFHEGSHAFAELEAFKDALAKGDITQPFFGA